MTDGDAERRKEPLEDDFLLPEQVQKSYKPLVDDFIFNYLKAAGAPNKPEDMENN